MVHFKFVALLSVLGFTLSGCFWGGNDPKEMATYHEAIQDDVKTMDPAAAFDSISNTVLPNVLEPLYQYSYLSDTYQLEPLLALDLPKLSADRLTVTIPLKRDVYFQDDPCFKSDANPTGKGRKVVATDFIYALKRLAHPRITSLGFWILDGKIKGINRFYDRLSKAPREEQKKIFDEPVEGLVAADEHTLVIKLVKPYPQLNYALAMGFAAPVAREAVLAYSDENGNINEKAVGTGPYILQEWNRGKNIILTRNPNFRADFYPKSGALEYKKKGYLEDAGKPLPFIDKLEFLVIKERQPAWLNLMAGRLDMMGIPKDNFGGAIQNQSNLTPELSAKGFRLQIEPSTLFYMVGFNMKDELLGKNKVLRQALSAAINREEFIEIFSNGRGLKMTQAIPPGILDRLEISKIKFDHDQKNAASLLAKAGYPEGKNLPVLKFDLRGADSTARQMGEYLVKQWKQIGVQVEAIYNTFPAYLDKAKDGRLQVFYDGWNMDYPDAENVLQLLYGANAAPGPNATNFKNAEYDRLYNEMSVLSPGPKRAALIHRMENLIQEESPWAYLYVLRYYVLSQPWLMNFRSNSIMAGTHKYLRINTEIKKRYLEAK